MMKGIVTKMTRGLSVSVMTVLMAGLAFTACTHERRAGEVEEGDQLLTFAPTVADTWLAAEQDGKSARATADSGLGSIVDTERLMLGEVAGDSLYLHITTTEGMAGDVGVTTTDSGALRAAPVTDMQTYSGFGVTAYHYPQGQSATGTPNLMNNEHISVKSSSNTWKATTPHRWMPSQLHDFYAWAPHGNSAYAINSPTGGAAPKLSVTIPNGVADQKDLLVAKATGVSEPATGIQNLTFKHALTAVRFVAQDVNSGIQFTSVTLEGVLSKGTYDLGTEQWTIDNTLPRGSFTQPLTFTSTGTAGEEITGGATTFMMLPQSFDTSNPLTIKIGYRDGAMTEEITGTLPPHVWEAGKTVTYEVSSNSINYSYTFTITQDPTSVPYTGGSSTFKITSTRQKSTPGSPLERVSFEIKEIKVAGQWTKDIPSWFNGGGAFNSAGGPDVSCAIELEPQNTSTQGIPGLATLQNATPKGRASSPYTLEDEGGTLSKETANCYVINAPGHYSLPLVYGNAITNGRTNESAYKSTVAAGNANILYTFINHLGQNITGADLPTPVSAGIVWQDEKDLVTDVRLQGGRLLFEVKKDNIREGNAVIAVYDSSDKAIWSWHIWVTAQDVFTPISVKTHDDYGSQEIKFMPCNLGEARGTTTIFPRREIRAKVVQVGSNKEIEVTFTQEEGSEGVVRSPYYQWGRKDPFVPSNGVDNTNQTWYDANGGESTSGPSVMAWSTGNLSISNGIANPGKFNTNSYMDDTYYNLWSMNNRVTTVNSNSVVKTIYDPSPRGYAMPPSAAFTGFSTSGATFNKGYHFSTGYPAPNDKIYFPASGFRYNDDASLEVVGSSGWYWVAGPGSTMYGRYLVFDSGNVLSQYGFVRSGGLSVRPAQII